MRFEFDPAKSEANLEKHGIDFLEAQELWADIDRVEFSLQSAGEKRFGVLAWYAGSVWLAIITYRQDAVRIISVRRATAKEVSFYDRTNHN